MERTSEEKFDTEPEAEAFIAGLAYPGNDHISYEQPYEDSDGKWVVEVAEFC